MKAFVDFGPIAESEVGARNGEESGMWPGTAEK